jgi:hypothetical protein
VSDEKPWKHPKYDVMNMANDDLVLASIAKLYKSEMLLAVAEVERLRAEVERLKHQVNYWRIEAETDNARWLRCLEDKEWLTKAGDAMAAEWVARESLYHGNEDFIADWNAAKEGKQS